MNEKDAFRKKALEAQPPLVRFTDQIRESLGQRASACDHIEFMMWLLESHPLIPFEKYSFGSDLLDFRRALAYEILLRILAHVRSLVANVNIVNRPGAGAAVRCILDMNALLTFLDTENRMNDEGLLDTFLGGQSFAKGADYFLNQEWLKQHGVPLPADTKKWMESLFGLPRTALITGAAHTADAGFSAMYARYSEYIHFVFSGPRRETEDALGHTEENGPFGSHEYFASGQRGTTPVGPLIGDIEAASFTLQLTWPLLLSLDPFMNETTSEAVKEALKQQGLV
jgi:hypothetical protein